MLSCRQVFTATEYPLAGDPHRQWSWPLVVFTCALAVRLIVLFQFRELNPLFDNPVVDAWRYDTLAKDFLRLGSWPEPGAFFQPPAYPFFLAAVYALFGESYTWVRIIQACLGSFSCVFICLLGTKLYSGKIGLSAGMIMALYGPLIFFELDLLAPVLIVFWSTLGLLLLHCGLENSGKTLLLLAGLCLGAALVTWPITGLFSGCVLALAAWSLRTSPRRTAAAVMLVGLGLVIPVLPVLLHNIMHGEWVLVSTNGGINFFIGNNPDWQETVAMRPGYPWEKIVTLPYHLYGREQVNAAGSSALFFREAFNFIAAYPVSYARIVLVKLYQLVFGYEIMRNTDLYFFKQYSPVLNSLAFSTTWLKFPFGLLMPFGATGIFLSWRKPGPGNKYLLAFLGSVSLGLLLFFVTSRYRVVLVPVLAIYSSIGFWGVLAAAKQNNTAALSILGILLIMGALANFDMFNQQRQLESPIYQAQATFTLGRVDLERNNPEKALAWQEESVRIDPSYPDAWVDMGRSLFALGRTAEAVTAMNEAISVAPDYPLPYFNLALIHDRPDMPPELAVGYYREFLVRSEAYFENSIRGSGRTTHAQDRIAALNQTGADG